MSTNSRGFIALVPFIAFLVLYISVGVWCSYQGTEFAFYQFPAASCALIGFGIALLLGYRNLNEQIRTFVLGIGDENVILMCLIFMLAGAFSVITKTTGAIDSAVNMGLYFLPSYTLIPGLFLISCLISFAMGTSMGTISTIIPIALGIASKADLDLALTVGTIVGGAMFGDNLSVISDTTVAATSTQGCTMKEKMISNLKLAVPAALGVLALLCFFSKSGAMVEIQDFSYLKALPYLVVIGLALTGLNVVVVLMLGIASAAFIGIATDSIGFIEFGKATYEGFLSMAEVFFLTVLSAGLAAIATREGGLSYLLSKLQRWIRSKRSAEFGIAALVSLADICIANNTVAIIVTGPMVKEIAERFNIAKARAASLIDVYSCVWQGLIPYGAQLLLAGGLAKLSPFQIIPYTWYPIALGIVATVSIMSTRQVRN